MMAYHYGAVTYEPFTITLSIQWLAMIIVGGLGSIPGAIFGSVFLTIMPIGLRELVDVLRPSMPFLADPTPISATCCSASSSWVS